ncbi:unnamed protein product, partial [Musa acuminata var. zebrina]
MLLPWPLRHGRLFDSQGLGSTASEDAPLCCEGDFERSTVQ